MKKEVSSNTGIIEVKDLINFVNRKYPKPNKPNCSGWEVTTDEAVQIMRYYGVRYKNRCIIDIAKDTINLYFTYYNKLAQNPAIQSDLRNLMSLRMHIASVGIWLEPDFAEKNKRKSKA